ncbi:MAG: riboflavin biosynthesis protein RibF [Candidatus Omnitrophota bacterium]
MKVVFGPGALLEKNNKCCDKVVAVGVFDGVHRGHQLVLRSVVRDARRHGLRSVVVTFASHPSHYFHPKEKVPALTSLEHKLFFIEKEGIDICYVIDFNESFASLSPEGFIKKTLIDKIGMVSLYVGEDFLFGKGVKGDCKVLEKLRDKFGFRLHVLKHLGLRHRIVSSTLIRNLIKSGRLDLASFFLGRRVSFLGEVVRGEGRGGFLGFPTANIRPHHEVLAPDGIYVTFAFCQGRVFRSLTYIGKKPTFRKKRNVRSIEVYIFGLNKNIYHTPMEVRFIKKIRDDQKFSSQEALVAQMKKDVFAAEKIFKKLS